MKREKVIHIGYSHSPYDSRIYEKECCSLAEEGMEVGYITSNKSESEKRETKKGVKVKIIPLKNNNRIIRLLWYYYEVFQQVKRVSPEICHIHEFLLLPLLPFLKKRHITVIYDMHEDTPRQMYPRWKRKYGKRIGKGFIKWIEWYEDRKIRQADYIITATPHIRKRVKRITDKVSTVCNYPILAESVSREEEKERAICFAGTLAYDNGLVHMMKAVKQTDVIFYIAGEFDKKVREFYELEKGNDQIRYLGYLNRQELYTLYAKCMAGIDTDLPTENNRKALPIKLFEFMNAGLPVISSDFSLRKKIISSGESSGLCVNPFDINEIKEAILFLADHKEKAEQMGKSGKKKIIECYNWEKEKRKLIAIYQNIWEVRM